VSYLNDAAASLDGKSIYITDMGANTKMHGPNGKLWPLGGKDAREISTIGRVYQIGLDGEISIAIDANSLMPCPNGVGVGKDGQLMVGAFFTGNLLELRDGKLDVVADSFRGADAVEQDREGNYFVSSWKQGRAWKVAPDGKSSRVVIDGLKSAADFYLDEENRRLLVPDMLAGTVNVSKY
jgi:sugar lactone lactonase YvrE